MIQQVRFSDKVKFFKAGFCRKWNIHTYNNTNASCLFVGVYDIEDVNAINKHNGLKVIWNTGGPRDCFMMIATQNVIVIDTGRQRLSHIRKKYKTKRATFPIKDFSDFTPTLFGDKIYCYIGHPQMREEYGYSVMRKLEKISPFEIIYASLGQTMEYVRDNYYTPSFVNIRPSIIGGYTTAIELAHMGRKTISNSNTPFYLGYKDIDDMLSVVMNESKKIGTIQKSVIGDFFDTGEEWMDENFWT